MATIRRGEMRNDTHFADYSDIAEGLGVSPAEAAAQDSAYFPVNARVRGPGVDHEDVARILAEDAENRIPKYEEGGQWFISRLSLRVIEHYHGVRARRFVDVGV